jgi:hypothetical protein
MSAAEAALRWTAHRGRGDWAALVAGRASSSDDVARDLADEMDALGDVAVERVDGAAGADDLAARVAGLRGPVVIAGLDGWSPAEWAHFDRLRSRFARAERSVLVLRQEAFEHLMREAPNFSSWLGASLAAYLPGASVLDDAERGRRLAALQAWSGLSDAEVVAQATAGTLPAEPEYAEWLVLLRHGDLLER